MLFQFLKHISPIWYFNLTPVSDTTVFDIDLNKLTPDETQLLTADDIYQTTAGSQRDLAYQAIQKGFIKESEIGILSKEQPNLIDNYRFLRKYYHSFWSLYVLFIRLITFHNPYKEIKAWLLTSHVKRINIYDTVYPHEDTYQAFQSLLLHNRPKVSVIIPTLNRYNYLADVLKDLEQQDYPNFEVIVIDQSEPFNAEFYNSFQIDIQVIHQTEKALWLARNTAIKKSNAEYLLLFDDDSRVEPNWINEHLKAIDYFKADISAGVSISLVGAKVPESYSFFRMGDQVDTGNVMIHRRVFEKIGLFDRQFEKQRMGDGEFGLRAYLAGFTNISNPYAKRLHLKVGEGGLRQMGSWDAFRPKNWWAPRPVPSVLYLVRKYYGNRLALNLLLISVPPSLVPYRFKRKPFLLLLGSLLIVPLAPVVLWQVYSSWQKATQMLRDTSKIEFLQDREY